MDSMNDLFAYLPPQEHLTEDELEFMRGIDEQNKFEMHFVENTGIHYAEPNKHSDS